MVEPVKYLVKIEGDTAYMAVVGRASYLNCRHAGEFLDLALARKCRFVRIDFSKCAGMDSTFMGMMAGVALKLGGGAVSLFNIEGRNLELIENVGLDEIVKIGGKCDFRAEPEADSLGADAATKSAILRAHKKLVEADASNAAKFQDVIAFLQGQADGENS